MKVSSSIRAEINCHKADNLGKFGGQTISKTSFLKRYSRRRNGAYQLAVTGQANMDLN